MHISADLDKLRQHRDDLQQQFSLAARIVTRLEQLQREDPDITGMNGLLYHEQIRFAKNLAERLRQRRELLSETIDILSQAHYQLSDSTTDALYQLRYDD